MMTPEERKGAKKLLAAVFTTTELKAEFAKASKAAKNEPSDYRSGMLGAYAGILKEIIDDRAKPVDLTGTVQGPSLEQLRKKYGVKK